MKEQNELRELNEIAYDFTDLMAQINLTVNYLSSLSFQFVTAKSVEDRNSILISLFHEKGLDNVMDVLKTISEKTDDLSCEVLDHYEAKQDTNNKEVATNEK